MATTYQKVKLEEVPKDNEGRFLMDLYVSLPTANKFIRFLCAGDELETRRLEALKNHVVPEVFLSEEDFQRLGQHDVETLAKSVAPVSTPPEFKVEVIGKAAEANLKEIFKSFMDPTSDPAETLKRFEQEADKIVDIIAPETKNLKENLLKNIKYVNLMNDASAITSLAIFVALASGFDSKKSYRDLTYACLVMDASLTQFTEAEVELFYKDRPQLPPDVLAKMLKHPAKSHELASQKMKSLSEVSLQLILCHHELFNGKGYPRGIRSESLFPMVRVLALAVDLFETMKRAELNGKMLSIIDALMELKEDTVEPHLRRHSKKLIDSTLNFMTADPDVAGA